MATEENPHAGQGPVVLDIGGDVGALIVVTPAWMENLEVEIIPTGTDSRPPQTVSSGSVAAHDHPGVDAGDHRHLHERDQQHFPDDAHHYGASGGLDSDHQHPAVGAHSHGSAAPPHVAVVARPTPDGSLIHSLVYGSLMEGTYDLYVRPFGPVHMHATVVGGQVTQAHW